MSSANKQMTWADWVLGLLYILAGAVALVLFAMFAAGFVLFAVAFMFAALVVGACFHMCGVDIITYVDAKVYGDKDTT